MNGVLVGEVPLGLAILRRIEQRERAQAQFLLLRALSQTELSKQFILSGSAALHMVFLKGRFSVDIDFISPPEYKQAFIKNPSEFGISLETITFSDGSLIPIYVCAGNFSSRVALRIDISARDVSSIASEISTIRDPRNGEISIRHQSLWQILYEKLNCISRRCKPSDYYDLWLALNSFPEMKNRLRSELDNWRYTYGFELAVALRNLNNFEDQWVIDLAPSVLSVPAYDLVRHDLGLWLSQL